MLSNGLTGIDLTNEEKKTINEIENKVLKWNEYKNDSIKELISNKRIFYRFLVAHNWKKRNALKTLKITLKWRIKFKPDTIELNEISLIHKHLNSVCVIPFKTEFLPIAYQPVLYLSLKNSLMFPDNKNGDCKFRHVVYTLETVYKHAMPNNFHRFSLVVDAGDVDLSVVATILKIGTKFQKLHKYYPEVLYRAYVVNVPWIMLKVWTVVKLFLDKETVNKFVFLENISELNTYISKDQLSVDYGGDLKRKNGLYL